MKKTLSVFLLFTLLSYNQLSAQDNNYARIDEQVNKLGPLSNFNVATIADTITSSFSDKQSKARAIFYWIANNISIDPKATRSNDKRNVDPVAVIQLRKTTPLGFSLLFQEMSSLANIRCLSVDGYVKYSAGDINNKADELNHSWNVVQLGQSPEQWYYIDAAKASGFTDARMSTFTKQFTSEYFFANKALFNLDHFPDNEAWMLGQGPKSLKEFYGLPVISNAAYNIGLQKPFPLNGLIRIKAGTSQKFSFTYNNKAPLKNISLVMGEEKKLFKPAPMNFTDNGGLIEFSYQFKLSNSCPLRVVADGNVLLEYYIEVED